MTARSDRDLTPQSIVQKVSDASGSIYSGGSTETSTTGPPPPMSSKPVFTPTQNSSGSSNSFNPLASRSRSGFVQNPNVDEDGWGADAPPVTRTQLEKVQSSYQPTKVNLQDLDSNKEQILNKASGVAPQQLDDRDVIKGGYQPVGKVDIAAIRRQAQQQDIHDRPTPVKGAYEPVGKVDIAAIRARAQPSTTESESPPIRNTREANGGLQPTTDRSAPFKSSERLTSLPKPKLASRFGPVSDSFAGTKALTPEHLGLNSKSVSAAPSPGAGRTFADQGGKTPAQVWAEKKARERGVSGASDGSPATGLGQAPTPVASQISGGNDWKSGYTGKTWTPVQTTRTGQSSSGVSEHRTGPHDDEREEIKASSTSDVGAIRDKFKDSAPIGAANVGDRGSTSSPPVLDTSNKPNAGRGIPIPGLPAQSTSVAEAEQNAQRLPSPPPQPPRSPTPPTPPAASGSPIRLAMPISRGHNDQDVENAREEQITPPPAMPTRSLAQAVPHEDDLTLESPRHDPARATGEAAASSSFGGATVESARPGLQQSGKRAVVQYDYEKAEDNELELKENEYVTDIEMVDENWWMGKNSHGETGLFPSNYVEVVEDDEHDIQKAEAEPTSAQAMAIQGASATALYDYEAAEDNELTFPEHAKITGVVSKGLQCSRVYQLMVNPGISRRRLVVR